MATLDLFSSYSANLGPFFPKSVPLAPSFFFWPGCEHSPPGGKKKKKTSYDQQFICVEDSGDMKKLNLVHSHN
jgi:hypothetical protein